MIDDYNSIKILNQISKIEYKNKLFYQKIISTFGERIIDILLIFPNGYTFRHLINHKMTENEIDKLCALDLEIISYEPNFNKKTPFIVNCKNSFNQYVKIILFNYPQKLIEKKYIIGRKYRITGNVKYYNNFFQIFHPESTFTLDNLDKYESIEPIYNLSRLKLNRDKFRDLIKKNLKEMKNFNFPEEWIFNEKIKKESWKSFKEAIIEIHCPDKKLTNIELEKIRKRLAYDEILSNFITLSKIKLNQKNHFSKYRSNKTNLSKTIINNLEFKLTNDQVFVFDEIKNDLASNNKMYRLLQGDVGSGKTIIALLSMVTVVKSGFQTTLMVPTEVLANQHYQYFTKLLKSHKIKIALLTGKTNKKDKKIIYDQLINKEIDILIGTQSLFNKNLVFADLGLIVIDEQHKFGVNQRLDLQNKSHDSNILIMSATPIPRSLTFAIYGEINISIIKDKPKNRKKITTNVINYNKIDNLILGIKRKIENNEKIFWILPEIGKQNDNENDSIFSRFEYLNRIFPKIVAFVHGKMDKKVINETIHNFKNDNIMILVSTTVIEVGIDIPCASLIVIENANKFGLAQLHQLRGRVGRGSVKSNCVLIYKDNLTSNGRERLLIMKNSSDGFFIAEQDLKLRGGGEIFGIKQAGLPHWRFFNPYNDLDLIEDVKKNCKLIMLSKQKYRNQISLLTKMFFKESNIQNYLTG